MSWPMPWMVRPVGIESIASRFSTCVWTAVCTSTVGASPVTVSVSSRLPTFMSALMVIVNCAGSSSASRLKDWNPSSEKVTL